MMERIDPARGVPPHLAGGTLALGNFDGVHIGHQAVIGHAIAHAHAQGRPALVATFDPHPSRYFRPDSPPFALTAPAQKIAILAGLGVDGVVVIPFDAHLAGLSAEEFSRVWLADRLQAAHVVTGRNFHFGKGRAGNAGTLAALGAANGFTAEALESIGSRGAPVSSTRIRAALRAGEIAEATTMLSRPFTIIAPVIPGQQLGRTIGIPTANQTLGVYQRPRYGVYAVRLRLPDGQLRDGVANFGVRPMIDSSEELLESWIFDWSGDLYGQDVAVQFIAWLRPELKLPSLDALQAQIAQDAADARRVLAKS